MAQAGARKLDRAQLDGRACVLCTTAAEEVAHHPVGRIDGIQMFICSPCAGAYTVRHLEAGGEIRLADGEINAMVGRAE